MPKLEIAVGENTSLPADLQKYVSDGKLIAYVGDDVQSIVAGDLSKRVTTLEAENQKAVSDTQNYINTNASLADEVKRLKAQTVNLDKNPYEEKLGKFGKPEEVENTLKQYEKDKPTIKDYRLTQKATKVAEALGTSNIAVVKDRIRNSDGVIYKIEGEGEALTVLAVTGEGENQTQKDIKEFVKESDVWKPFTPLLTNDGQKLPYTPPKPKETGNKGAGGMLDDFISKFNNGGKPKEEKPNE